MNLITKDNLDKFLDKFERLDGAVIVCVNYLPSVKLDESEISLQLKAYDSSTSNSEPFSGEVLLKIAFKGNVEFRISEPGGGGNVVINDEVIASVANGKTYINFDPLHTKNANGDLSAAEVHNSSFYVGGNEMFWGLMPQGVV